MQPGMPKRRTHDYACHGVTSLFAAFDIADCTVISELHRRHRHQEFLKFLKKIAKNVQVTGHADLLGELVAAVTEGRQGAPSMSR